MILFNELHLSKGQYPILVTDFGMAMLSKEVQLAKALSSMVVTQSGMVMLQRAAAIKGTGPNPSH